MGWGDGGVQFGQRGAGAWAGGAKGWHKAEKNADRDSEGFNGVLEILWLSTLRCSQILIHPKGLSENLSLRLAFLGKEKKKKKSAWARADVLSINVVRKQHVSVLVAQCNLAKRSYQ